MNSIAAYILLTLAGAGLGYAATIPQALRKLRRLDVVILPVVICSFYAAWATPILHDALAGLRINGRCEVIDVRGQVIPGLYGAGESAGGFALHGLPRVTVFGRIAGREAARARKQS